MRRELFLLILCICAVVAFADRAWFASPRKAAAGPGFVVNSIGDESDAASNGVCLTLNGVCTLRAAIEEANNTPTDNISFSLAGTAPHVIAPASALPALTDNVAIDGTTQPDYSGSPVVVIDGVGAGVNVTGLNAQAGGTTIRGLNIQRFFDYGIRIGSVGGNFIEGNYIGTDETGTLDRGNGLAGIRVDVGGNTIGGTTTAARNVISGNNEYGVFLTIGASIVQGNYIGLNAAGTGAIGNSFSGVDVDSVGNTIGGTAAGARNVISGNGNYGVDILSVGAGTVQGNYIGLNAAGTGAVGNVLSGIYTESGGGNIIGGAAAGARNVISGNGGHGILVTASVATGNMIRGNYIGTDVNGTADLGNANDGVRIMNNASSNTVGGTAAGEGNVISGNGGNGVLIQSSGSTGNTVAGNYVGTNAAGTADMGNTASGIYILRATGNTIGGTVAGAGNVISGNDGFAGVAICGNPTFCGGEGAPQPGDASGNLVQGNFVGTNAAGTGAVANAGHGVSVDFSPNTTIGGTVSAARNVISGNSSNGILVFNGATGTAIQGNYIGTNAAGTGALGNTNIGVLLLSSGSSNTIGGTVAAARNVISANGDGIVIQDSNGNQVLGNFVGTNVSGTSALANNYGVGISPGSANNTIGGTSASARNVISGNTSAGVLIYGAGTTGNQVLGNYIGTNAAGTGALGNTFGVSMQGGTLNDTIGGTAPGEGNVIAYNTATGVFVSDPPLATSGITIRGNSVYSNGGLGIDLVYDGVTANDNLDPDTGPNNLQNFPLLTSAQTGSAIIKGSLNSTASSIFLLDFYASTSCDGSGSGEGQTYLGASAVVTDGIGNATFEVVFDAPLSAGQAVTATATDTAGNTSEFSACFTATLPVLTTVVGTGTAGSCDSGTAGSCPVNQPHGLHEVYPPEGVTAGQGEAASSAAYGLYWADTGNNKVKLVSPPTDAGTVSVVAGGGGSYCNNCGPLSTSLDGLRDVFIAGKGVYIADTNNCIVRRVDLAGSQIRTVAGQNDVCSSTSTAANGDGGNATSATLNSPRGVAVDAAGNLYIADTLNHRIRMVAPETAGDGIVDGDAGETITTIAGTGTASVTATDPNGDGGPATAATLNQPHDLYFLAEDLFIADTNNNKIRRIDYPTGTIATVAGTGTQGYTGDNGPATLATLRFPEALMAANSRVVIADTKNHVIRMVDLIGHPADGSTPAVAAGTITTIYDQQAPCREPSPPSPCKLNEPAGVFIVSVANAADGTLRVSNTLGQTITTAGIDPTGTHTTNIRPSVSCGNVPGVSGIDWVLPFVLLGAIAGRRRIGMFFTRVYAIALRRAPAPAAP